MRFALEFHDSEIRDVLATTAALRVRFAAACVRDPHGNRGWLTGVTLALADATLAGDPAHALGRLSEGRLRQDGRDVVRPALPGTLTGALELTLRFANGTLLTAHGRSLASTLSDDARFTEDLSC
ncbi:MAG: hypothetical protein ACJ8GJ_11075 [Vitreoscilla sp.]